MYEGNPGEIDGKSTLVLASAMLELERVSCTAYASSPIIFGGQAVLLHGGMAHVCDICLIFIYFILDYFFRSFIWVQISGHDQSCFVLLKFFLFEENCKVTKIWKIHHCAALF